MSLAVSLTKRLPTKDRVKSAVQLLRITGFFDVADRICETYPRMYGSVTLYTASITHNLSLMAKAAGIYREVWRPEEYGITKASQLIEPLERGIKWLKENQVEAERLNALNGWGTYNQFIPWLGEYLKACRKTPDADISVSK